LPLLKFQPSYLNGDGPSIFGGKLQRAVSNQVSSGCKWSGASTPFICLSRFIHWRLL